MRQFNVHLNQGRTRTSVPLIVLIQSDCYEDTTRRVVDTLQLATIRIKGLGLKVGTFHEDYLSVIRTCARPSHVSN